MSEDPKNLLFIMSDEHSRQMLSCYGHPVVQTPNLDRLSENGVRFNNAYCNSPICVPSRASLATGRYVHETKNWDNAAPYTGEVPSWGHRLIDQGHDVRSIGKLHYRDEEDDNGFKESRMPLNVPHGVGDIYGLVRDDMDVRNGMRELITDAGPGESSYTRYDEAVAEEARKFLKEEARDDNKPWVLFVSFVTPHFPLVVPQKYYDMYPLDSIVFPKQYSASERPRHPVLDEFRRYFRLDDELEEKTVRKAVASYYGLCTFLDNQIGKVLDGLDESGLSDNTRIIYTSDHGDSVGDHGLWFKHSMYEESAGIPFLMSGPGLPENKTVDSPISLVDCFPTIVESVGGNLEEEDQDLPGSSLYSFIKEENENRVIFSEYHGVGYKTGVFMIRKGKFKYVHYVDHSPQLFDLEKDPEEVNNLEKNPDYRHILEDCKNELYQICNPEEVNELAKKDQKKIIDKFGGRQKVMKKGPDHSFSPAPSIFNK